MSSFRKISVLLGFVLVIALCVFAIKCNRDNKNPSEYLAGETIRIDNTKYNVVRQASDTVYVTRTVVKNNYIPKYVRLFDTIVVNGVDTVFYSTNDTVFRLVDTASILREFYANKQYVDTVTLSYDDVDVVHGIITDDISQNSIINRNVVWQVVFSNFYNETVIAKPNRYKVFFGFAGGFDRISYISNLETGLLLQSKDDNIYQVGVGIQNSNSNGLQPYIHTGVYWKIKL